MCRGNGDLYINPRLRSDWLVVVPDGEVVLPGLSYIGRYGNMALYTTSFEDYHEFILFVLEAASLGSTAGQSGKGGPSKSPQGSPNAVPQITLTPNL
jgi:hypothetical protein